MRSDRVARLVLALATGAVLGCSESAPIDEPRSAPPIETLSLSEPVRTLGAQLEGDLLLSGIHRVEPSPSGGFVVVEPEVPRVLVFDGDGSVVESFSAKGEGPGEFMGPRDVGFVGDTLWVVDRALDRISYFHEGAFVASARLPAYPDLHPERGAHIVALVEGRRSLVHTILASGIEPVGITSAPGFVAVADSSEVTRLLDVDVNHVGGVVTHREGGEVVAVSLMSQPFSEAGKVTPLPDGSGIVVASSTPSGYEVLVLDLEGDTLRRIQQAVPPIPIEPEAVDSIVQARVQGPFTEAAVLEALHLPDRYPPVSDVVAEADGSIWVARERVFLRPLVWDIHHPDGSVARVSAPPGFDLKVPVGDGVWGVERDEFDVQYLTFRRLEGG